MRLKLSLLLLALLSAPLPALSAENSQGKLIFAVQLVETSEHRVVDGSEYPKKRTGIFYYYEENARGGASITGYKMQNGKEIGRVGGGSIETTDFLEKLKALPLSSFDVQKEIDSTIADIRADARKNGRGFQAMPRMTDGSRYRILYDFNGVHVDYTAWNPGVEIQYLAAYSSNLKNLNDLLDLIALHYGRRQLW
jgi:hypothetical protein